MNTLQQSLNTAIDLRMQLLSNQDFQDNFYACVDQIEAAFKADKKLLLCGNGGSAGDAQHIAAELSGRFLIDRAPLFAEALHVNSSYLTAVANDYGYDEVYVRMTEAMGRAGDVLIGLSTSGNSKNVVKALQKAKSIGMVTVAFLGDNKGEMAKLADHVIQIPSSNTARIQELHITIGHVLCEELEQRLFAK
jgi:D-sedoheptulose 7-phosphate isomerase